MQLHVGTTTYTVVLSDRSIYDSEGNELEGCAVEGRRLIILSRIVEPSRREEVAEHEFYHCWLFHVPTPKTEEEAAQLHSLVARQFRHDLDTAGGLDVLLNLKATRIQLGRPTTEGAEMPQGREWKGSGDRTTCGGCDSEVMAGSIHTGPAIAHEPTGRFHVERWMHCDACGIVQVWHEVAASDGMPLGEVRPVPQPKVLRGAEASAWIAEHEAIGV